MRVMYLTKQTVTPYYSINVLDAMKFFPYKISVCVNCDDLEESGGKVE